MGIGMELPQQLHLQPAHTLTAEQLAALFNEAFAGYIGGEIHMTSPALAQFLASANAHLDLSQVFVRDGQPVGFGYVARQGWVSRLAAFGIIPAAAGAGVGKATMTQMLAQARERGDREYVLEVIEQNTRAVRLYQGVGFEIVRRLVGYKLESARADAAAVPSADLRAISTYEVARVVVQHGAPDLPWQMAGTALARSAPPDVGYELEGAYAVISNPAAAVVALKALIIPPELRQQGRAARLLRALFAAHPQKTWVISAVCPEEIGAELFASFGFERQAISQWQMRLSLV
jgi:ribosomal protein S18 acetylase RimI-like enzyme